MPDGPQKADRGCIRRRPGNPRLSELLVRHARPPVSGESQRAVWAGSRPDKDRRTSRLGGPWGNVAPGELQAVRGTTDAFRQVEQAEAVLGLVFDAALPAYRDFHRDLLFHQTDEALFQPFFLGRMCEAVLQQGGPWDEADRIVPAALRQLNDYLGHRPVAVLRTEQKIQPYEHEWVRPIPLWIRGAGAAAGPYRELVETALAILDATDPPCCSTRCSRWTSSTNWRSIRGRTTSTIR